jgi:kumamolisin
LWAGLIARTNRCLGRRIGYLNPVLYEFEDQLRRVWRDVTAGSNGYYKAGRGWDACTGWGTPVGTAIIGVLTGKSAAKK